MAFGAGMVGVDFNSETKRGNCVDPYKRNNAKEVHKNFMLVQIKIRRQDRQKDRSLGIRDIGRV